MKCVINDKNEIYGFWNDDSKAPKHAVTCDKTYTTHGTYDGSTHKETLLYKLVDGKVEDNT
tara:strand:- start:253 stop:435 length:183 start_codon:yes stop_codon:yes gene_type:complete